MRRRPPTGFTLIELAGVLVLTALLAGSTAIMFASSRQRIEMDEAIQQFVRADGQIRNIAQRSSGAVQLSIDLAKSVLSRRTKTADGAADNVIIAELPGRIRIEQVRVGSELNQFGEANIRFSPAGSPTYAVLLTGSGGRRQWIAMMGLSGQSVRVSDDEIEPMFDSIAAAGLDTH